MTNNSETKDCRLGEEGGRRFFQYDMIENHLTYANFRDIGRDVPSSWTHVHLHPPSTSQSLRILSLSIFKCSVNARMDFCEGWGECNRIFQWEGLTLVHSWKNGRFGNHNEKEKKKNIVNNLNAASYLFTLMWYING